MTKIKLCGLTRQEDITAANVLEPDFVGFVFAPKSRRYVTAEQAKALRNHLLPSIQAVGVFVDEEPEQVAALLEAGIIDLAQLHGREDEGHLERLRALTGKPIIQAFQVKPQTTWSGPSPARRTTFCWTPGPEREPLLTGGY